jgi:hypothetical protein
MRTLLVALCFVLLAACGSSTTVNGTFPPQTAAPTIAPTAPPTPAPTPITLHGTKLFQTPSGNIGCVMASPSDQAFARCDIGDRTWKSPPKPKTCPLDYGNGVILDDGNKATYTCAGDTTLHQGDKVAYGQKLLLGSIECDVETIGVTCTNEATQHGFFISNTTVRLS